MDLDQIIDNIGKLPEPSKNALKEIISEVTHPKGHMFTSCMGKVKETTGSEMYWWFTGFIISMSISMFLLIKATQALPIGTAYAVWTGIGAVGTVLAGILIFKEPSTIWRLFFIATLIGSIIGLKAVSH